MDIAQFKRSSTTVFEVSKESLEDLLTERLTQQGEISEGDDVTFHHNIHSKEDDWGGSSSQEFKSIDILVTKKGDK